MDDQYRHNFNRIAKAIEYISNHFKEQPDLDKIASAVNLSPFHFQRLFTEWAGVSPKRFLQYINLEYAKKILAESKASLSDVAFETGLSGTGRLHDMFIQIEGMTPGEYKNGGENLTINYNYTDSPFGIILVASTPKGICHLAFADDEGSAFQSLQGLFPKAIYSQMTDSIQQDAVSIFKQDWLKMNQIKLHLKGTLFQLKVWEALLRIPLGKITTYGNIAKSINRSTASRAVGSAIGDNPVAFLIPCHRVIQSSGAFGQYHWGSSRKTAMIGWEAAKVNLKCYI
jgi:AraC family transcriptional regulator of adaptative response/methylated-DNA-[protein]-cysteine methyltransferase